MAPTAGPSMATTRRLMKEASAAMAEMQQQQPQQAQDDDLFGDEAEQQLQTHITARKGTNPDLLELRPYDAEGEDLYEWVAVIRGPQGGSYEGGKFEINIAVPQTYPTKPPTMTFKTRIWHPNVSWKTGEICLDVLSSQWSPAWTLSSACTAVIALLDAPEPDSPLNVDAATVLRTGDVIAYRSMARMYTLLYATGEDAGGNR